MEGAGPPTPGVNQGPTDIAGLGDLVWRGRVCRPGWGNLDHALSLQILVEFCPGGAVDAAILGK